MKRFSIFALLLVLGSAFSPVLRAEEEVQMEAVQQEEAVQAEAVPTEGVQTETVQTDTAPVATPDVAAVVDLSVEVVPAAWVAVKDSDPDLAAKLAKISSGDKTNASGTLKEAAVAVKESNPTLAGKLEKLASDWSTVSTSRKAY